MKKSVALLASALWCLACKNPTTSHPRAIVSDESMTASQAGQNAENQSANTGQQGAQAPQSVPPNQSQGAQPAQGQGTTGATKPPAAQNPTAQNPNVQNPASQMPPQTGSTVPNTSVSNIGGCAAGYAPVPSTTVISLGDPDCWSAPKDGTRVGYYAKGSLLCMRRDSVQPVRNWSGTWHVIEVQVTLKGQTAPTKCWTECKYTSNRATACGICDECV